MADATLDLLGKQRDEILIVGTHPSLNPSKSVVGDGITSGHRFPPEYRTHVVGQPLEVLYRIDRMTAQNRMRFPVVLAAFEAHHLQGQHLSDFFGILASLSHGTVIMADYTMAGQSAEKMREFLRSRIEITLQAQYGDYETWFRAHDVFTAEEMGSTFRRSSDWSSMQAFEYAHHQTGIIGSEHLSKDELELIQKL